MEKKFVITGVIVSLYIIAMLVLGYTGSDFIREGMIGGWLWIFPTLIGLISLVLVFIATHQRSVNYLRDKYPNILNKDTTWYQLIGKPALVGLVLHFLIMAISFSIILYFGFGTDLQTMKNEAASNLGDPLYFFILAATSGFIGIFFVINGVPFLEKYTEGR